MIVNGYEIEPCADLRDANLRDANLRGADLRDANLREVDLLGADLRWTDFRWADLREADVSGASGFLLLPVQDSRGYPFIHAVLQDEWMVRAGCRFLTIAQAREHWGSKSYPDRDRGDDYLYAIDWLERKIRKQEAAA